MIREIRASASRGLGRRITGRCGGNGEAPRAASGRRPGSAWAGPKAGRDYGYVIRREIEEK
jgi:hypothetical protein